jgi:DNA-binding transcriptional LysR family regulator
MKQRRRPSVDDMIVFAAVVDARSFSAAARRLALPKATVSRRVAELEEALGVRLLQRTTRAVTPTSIGATYHRSCTRIATEAADAHRLIHEAAAAPRGRVRMSVPVVAGSLLVATVASFLREHPAVELELIVTDRVVDLVAEQVDLVVRVASSRTESSLVSRTLATPTMRLYASPEYLARAGIPTTIDDLGRHEWVRVGPAPRWTFHSGAARRNVEVRGRTEVSSIAMACELAVSGVGVTLVPAPLAAPHVARGALLPLVSDWHVPFQIFALYPAKKHLSPVVRALLDALISGARVLAD